MFTPGSRHLKLSHCRVDWNSLLSQKGSESGIRNLLSLHLTSPKPPPPSDVLNDILDSSPNLQNLHLKNALPKDFEPKFKWDAPAIQHCFLQGGVEPTIPFLLRLLSMPFPSTSDLRLQCITTRHMRKDTTAPEKAVQLGSEAVEGFTRFINRPSLLRGKALELDDNQFDSSAVLWERAEDGTADIHSQLQIPAYARRDTFLMNYACVPEARMLLVVADPQEDWHEFFKKHPNVETLRFEGRPYMQHGGTTKPFEALTQAVHDAPGTASSGPPLVLPRLRKLSFQESYFGQSLPDMFLDALAKTLISRYELGTPIKTVEFLRCHEAGRIERDEVAGLRNRIPSEVAEVVGGHEGEIEGEF